MIDQVVQFFHITAGSLEVACDGALALSKIFSLVSLAQLNNPCYDLLFVAQKLYRQSPLTWRTRHVKGHQDDGTSIDNLDIYSKLNIEMDTMAKSFQQEAQAAKRHFVTIHEPWSLWIDSCKIGNDLDTVVYDTAHSPDARTYWANKYQVDEEIIKEVNWPAVKDALSTSSLSKRFFITKHAAGMCGVGKFMVRWKQRDSPACPRCGELEDATHVWRCHGADADRVWMRSLDNLKDWMASQDTDPDLADLLLDMLHSWRDDTLCSGQTPYGLQLLVT
jgi:hypothetical protein